MGNLLGGLLGGMGGGNSGGSSGYGQNSGNYGKGPELQCCDPVVDPISLLTTLAGIAGLALFLRQAVIDNNIMGGRSFQTFFEIFSNGVSLKVLQGMLQFSFWIIQQLKIFL